MYFPNVRMFQDGPGSLLTSDHLKQTVCEDFRERDACVESAERLRLENTASAMHLQNYIYKTIEFFSGVSPRSISSSQLHALLHFHLCPIYLIVSQGPYFI